MILNALLRWLKKFTSHLTFWTTPRLKVCVPWYNTLSTKELKMLMLKSTDTSINFQCLSKKQTTLTLNGNCLPSINIFNTWKKLRLLDDKMNWYFDKLSMPLKEVNYFNFKWQLPAFNKLIQYLKKDASTKLRRKWNRQVILGNLVPSGSGFFFGWNILFSYRINV